MPDHTCINISHQSISTYMTPEKIAQIQKDYEALTSFSNSELQKLANKHSISIDDLIAVIDL